MFEVHEITQDLLNRLLKSNVMPRVQLVRSDRFSHEFNDQELAEIRKLEDSVAAVVGIDIYQYSRFPTEKQAFIPHVFDLIYEETWHLIRQNFTFFFQDYGQIGEPGPQEKIEQREFFVSTGDGGYQILHTPIHGVLFILTFAMILRLYNSDRFMRQLHAKIGNVEVRYAMTLDEVYRYRENYYGAGIINNARMLSRDRLNRFLVEQNVHDWFLSNTVGVENLMSFHLEEFAALDAFKAYDSAKIRRDGNALIRSIESESTDEGFKSVSIQKIGKVQQKANLIDVYNLHIQALIHYQNLFKQKETITVSVGNLNVEGIGNDEA